VLDPAAAAAPAPGPSATTPEPAATEGTATGPAPQTSAAPVAPLRLAAAAVPAEQPQGPAPQPAAEPRATAPGQPGQPGPAPAGTVLAAIPLTVTVGGDFVAVADFVRVVQTDIDRAFVVDSLDITTGADAEAAGGGAVEATLTGRVFVFVDPEAATGPTTPAADAAGGSAPTPTSAPASAPTTAPTTAPTGAATTEASR
jgi:serine/threonine-protein kinase